MLGLGWVNKCALSKRRPPAPSPVFQDVRPLEAGPGPGCRDIKACPSQPACQSAYAGDVHGLFAVLSEDPSLLNSQDIISGDTPLIAACRRGNPRVVQYLLDQGADVHVTNKVRQSCGEDRYSCGNSGCCRSGGQLSTTSPRGPSRCWTT